MKKNYEYTLKFMSVQYKGLADYRDKLPFISDGRSLFFAGDNGKKLSKS